MGTSKRYSAEGRERAVRMVAEHLHEYSSQWAAIVSIAGKIGCTAESLRRWVHGSERDSGKRPGLSTSERERVKELERQVNTMHASVGNIEKIYVGDLTMLARIEQLETWRKHVQQ